MNFENITFRKSDDSTEDFEKLRNIHKAAIQKSVILSIGHWDDSVQKNRLEKNFKQAYTTLEFISYNNQVIGTINCRNKDFEDGQYEFIEQFYLLPEYQGKGLGSYLLNSKLSIEKETRLSVLKKDINTHKFYYKNGFVEYMEDEYQKYMKKVSQLNQKMKL